MATTRSKTVTMPANGELAFSPALQDTTTSATIILNRLSKEKPTSIDVNLLDNSKSHIDKGTPTLSKSNYYSYATRGTNPTASDDLAMIDTFPSFRKC